MALKKKLTLGLISAAVVPIGLLTISCNSNQKQISNENNFLDIDIWNSKSKKRFTATEISKSQLSSIGSLNSFYHSKIMIGGFGEPRKFYTGNSSGRSRFINYHAGNDILVRQNTALYAPANGEVISSWWYAPFKETIAHGVGGEIGFRMKVNSLNIDDDLKKFIYIKKESNNKIKNVYKIPKLSFLENGKYKDPTSWLKKWNFNLSNNSEWNSFLKKGYNQEQISSIKDRSLYIYTYFIHLSKKTTQLLDHNAIVENITLQNKKYKTSLSHITPKKPLKVHKGQIIGYVGGTQENGGWIPHVHVESYLYFQSPKYNKRGYGGNKLQRAFTSYQIPNKENDIKDTFWKKHSYMNSSATGTNLVIKNHEQWKKYKLTYQQYEFLKDGTLNTNDVYHLYDNKTPIVKALTT